MENNIDARKISFKKWVLPKTERIISVQNDIAIGYFDFLNVEPIKLQSKNPLEAYAEMLQSDLKANMEEENTICQHILAFTNLGTRSDSTGYDSVKLNKFWEEKSGFTYVSLLHVKNGICLKKVIQKVNHIFNQTSEKYHAICYFSLDYSDIVVCVKNVALGEYLEKICLINYDNNQQEGKLIRDAFSALSIDNELLELAFGEIEKFESLRYVEVKEKLLALLKGKYDEKILRSEFTAAFNFGIQNFNVFGLLYKKLRDKEIPFELYKLFGRHDFSFYFKQADIFWLIYMQYYIDMFSAKTLDKDKDEILFNCEFGIQILHSGEIYEDEFLKSEQKQTNKEIPSDDYEKAKEILEFLIGQYSEKEKSEMEGKGFYYNQLCLKPIIAIGNSILALLKNEFAEEFVLCFFEAFCMFLRYITKELPNRNTLPFYQCFNEYFDNFNSLINSAMHNERQFIQSPSFNAVFYDIPTKLMAYYTASTSSIMEIMATKEDKHYSLIFRPGFWQDVSIVPYSFNELAPVDRLLSVYINEQALYHPMALIQIMCHEVAHYVGDGNRKRIVRKKAWLKNMLHSFFHAFLQTNLGIPVDDINDEAVRECIEKLMENIIEKEDFYKESEGYTVEFKNLIFQTIHTIIESQKARKIILEAFPQCYNKETNSEFSFISDFRKFKIYLIRIKDYFGIENNGTAIGMKKYIIDTYARLESIFSEIYADLQMVLILGLGLKEYISTFLSDEKLSADNIRNKKAKLYYRIFNIVLLFYKIGKWNINIADIENSEVNKLLQCLRAEIEENEAYERKYTDNIDQYWVLQSEQTGNYIGKYIGKKILAREEIDRLGQMNEYWNINIQDYLLEALKSSCEEYNDTQKQKDIEDLRENCKIIDEYNDVIQVLDCVHGVNKRYSEKLYSIDYWNNIDNE